MPRRETGAVAQFPAALQSQLPLSSFDFMVVSGCWLHYVSVVQVISKNPTQGILQSGWWVWCCIKTFCFSMSLPNHPTDFSLDEGHTLPRARGGEIFIYILQRLSRGVRWATCSSGFQKLNAQRAQSHRNVCNHLTAWSKKTILWAIHPPGL